MIDRGEIDGEIEKLEQGRTTYANCEKLSILYNVRDHMSGESLNQALARATPIPASMSEFALACEVASKEQLVKILDEHMDALKILYPKEYQRIVGKLLAL
jgi:hypothetical protein